MGGFEVHGSIAVVAHRELSERVDANMSVGQTRCHVGQVHVVGAQCSGSERGAAHATGEVESGSEQCHVHIRGSKVGRGQRDGSRQKRGDSVGRERKRIAIDVDQAGGTVALKVVDRGAPQVLGWIVGVQFREVGRELRHRFLLGVWCGHDRSAGVCQAGEAELPVRHTSNGKPIATIAAKMNHWTA